MKKSAEKDSEKNSMEANSKDEQTSSGGPAATGTEQQVKTAEEQKVSQEQGGAEKKEDKSSGFESASRIAELEKLNAELQDQYLRKAADFDNYRKRMIREKQEAIDFANTNLLVDLVQILDDFDRAIAAGGTQEQGSPAAAFAEGVTMIRNRLGSMLENKYGLVHYPVKGVQFDPTIHEAISSLPSPDVTEPTVHEEFVKGYKLKDRVVRPAKVMVHMPEEKQPE